MRCRVISNGKVYDFSEACGASQIEIMFGGDTELDTFVGALEFAADTLRKQAEFGDTKADIETQLQKAKETVSELTFENIKLTKDVNAFRAAAQRSQSIAVVAQGAAKDSQNAAKEAQNIAKEAIGTAKELKKELYDNVTKMAVLRGKVIAWKGACLLFAGISAVELLFLLTH